MIAGALNEAHVGRKVKISSLDGLILGVTHRLRGRRTVDIILDLETNRGQKRIVITPKTEVGLSYSVMPKHWND